jgi:hypothetical protein
LTGDVLLPAWLRRRTIVGDDRVWVGSYPGGSTAGRARKSAAWGWASRSRSTRRRSSASSPHAWSRYSDRAAAVFFSSAAKKIVSSRDGLLMASLRSRRALSSMRHYLRVFKSHVVVFDQLRVPPARQDRHAEDLLHGGLEPSERDHLT